METCKKLLHRLWKIPAIIKFFLAFFSAAGLCYVFMHDLEESPVAYVVYVLSFYTLCVIVADIPPLIKKIKAKVYNNHHTARYLREAELRTRVSLYSGTVINLGYAVFKLFTGIYYRSVWFGAVAVYYMMLCLIRFFLIRNDRRSVQIHSEDDRRLHGLKSYRTCGVLLLALNAAMTGMVFQMIWQNKGYAYPGFVIYASAAYTFYRITMAIIRMVKMRKVHNPVLSAAKAMDLSIALMALFALQTAMFAAFGTDMDSITRQLMNAMTGGAVCFLVVCIAVFMIVRVCREINALQSSKTNTK